MNGGHPRILVLYWSPDTTNVRNAIRDHLRVFDHVAGSAGETIYYNALHGAPKWLERSGFDLIVLHTTLLCMRWSFLFYTWKPKIAWVSNSKALKIALPQDEYDHSEVLDDWLRELGVHIIVSNFDEKRRAILYPSMHDEAHFIHGYTGYIDNKSAERAAGSLSPPADRTHDIVYRASHLPYWFGTQGQLKHQVGDVVGNRALDLDMNVDISTRQEDTVTGDAWLDFLGSGRAVIGAESGSSVLDRRGEVRARIQHLLKSDPSLSFAEVSRRMPAGWDDHSFLAISPRHFEAITTKTCQVLIEGEYDGVLVPDVHYIPLKRDYSNLDEVLEKVRDLDLVTSMTDRAYDDIYRSGSYSYERFAESIRRVIMPLLPARRGVREAPFRTIQPVALRISSALSNRPMSFAALQPASAGSIARAGLVVYLSLRYTALRRLLPLLRNGPGARSKIVSDLLRLGLVFEANRGRLISDPPFRVVATTVDDGLLRLISVPPARSGYDRTTTYSLQGPDAAREVRGIEWDHREIGTMVAFPLRKGTSLPVGVGAAGIHRFDGFATLGAPGQRQLAAALESALRLQPDRPTSLARRVLREPAVYWRFGASIVPFLARIGPVGVARASRGAFFGALLQDLLRLRIVMEMFHRGEFSDSRYTTVVRFDDRTNRLLFTTGRRGAELGVRAGDLRPRGADFGAPAQIQSVAWDHSALGSTISSRVLRADAIPIVISAEGVYEFEALSAAASTGGLARILAAVLDGESDVGRGERPSAG